MNQQINFFQAEFRTEKQNFSAATLLGFCGAIIFAMFLIQVFAIQKLSGIENELQIMSSQETAAVERLETLRPVITVVSGEQSWPARLDAAMRTLEEKQLVFSLVQGVTLGDTQGFSRYLRSLARQDTDGLWLTHISLTTLADNIRLEGRALRAELVPAYLQRLAEEPPFAMQRFHQFQIDGPEDPTSNIVSFSMNSDAELITDVADSR